MIYDLGGDGDSQVTGIQVRRRAFEPLLLPGIVCNLLYIIAVRLVIEPGGGDVGERYLTPLFGGEYYLVGDCCIVICCGGIYPYLIVVIVY